MNSATTSAATVEPGRRVLLVACPAEDLSEGINLQAAFGCFLLPAGGVGDVHLCTPETPVYLIETGDAGPAPAATWRAELLTSLSLVSPEPGDLLPASWTARHPDSYTAARTSPTTEQQPAESDGDPFDDALDDESDEPPLQQLFIPLTHLAPLPRTDWIFTNELVRKAARQGRRFAPRAPTLVILPE